MFFLVQCHDASLATSFLEFTSSLHFSAMAAPESALGPTPGPLGRVATAGSDWTNGGNSENWHHDLFNEPLNDPFLEYK